MLTDRLIQHITSEYLEGEALELTPDTPLLELNIIDSGALFDLVDLLREETGVVVPLQEVTPENFMTVRSMAELVSRLRKAG